jgi:hypothetical protein
MRKVASPIQHILIILLAIISHGILDKFARFTYHPPMPLIEDWFWVSYHLAIALLTIYTFLRYWDRYKLGLIFSVLPDFDWIILHSSDFFSFQIPFWSEPILHKFFFGFLDLFPFNLNFLPDWTSERVSVILELALLAILFAFIHSREKEKLKKPALTIQEKKYAKSIDKINWVDKLSIFLTCMDHEQNIRTSYQSLLTTLETVIFGLVFAFYQLGWTTLLWVLAVAGIFFCICFGIACEFRADNVDFWRRQIIKLVSGTSLEEVFKGGKYRWVPLGKLGFWGEYFFGHWFEKILIPIMLIVWQIPLWSFPSPFTIRLCGILATYFWVLYTFHLKKLKGAYYE